MEARTHSTVALAIVQIRTNPTPTLSINTSLSTNAATRTSLTSKSTLRIELRKNSALLSSKAAYFTMQPRNRRSSLFTTYCLCQEHPNYNSRQRPPLSSENRRLQEAPFLTASRKALNNSSKSLMEAWFTCPVPALICKMIGWIRTKKDTKRKGISRRSEMSRMQWLQRILMHKIIKKETLFMLISRHQP